MTKIIAQFKPEVTEDNEPYPVRSLVCNENGEVTAVEIYNAEFENVEDVDLMFEIS